MMMLFLGFCSGDVVSQVNEKSQEKKIKKKKLKFNYIAVV